MSLSFNSYTGFHDPTVSYFDEVSEEVPHVDAEVAVQVTVLVPTSFSRQQVAERVNDALHRFHAGTWRVAPVPQRADAGSERATFVAIARVPLDDLHNLAERTKELSTEGLTLGEPPIPPPLTEVPIRGDSGQPYVLTAEIPEFPRRFFARRRLGCTVPMTGGYYASDWWQFIGGRP